jgi:small-conductance mechanosensitive channel
MTRHCTLAFTAGLHLAAATWALRYAVERELATDALGVRCPPAEVAKDAWFIGTGITPPLALMAVQAMASTVVVRRPSVVASRTLGVIGAAMALSYAVERESRRALTSWDSRVTPLTAAGIALTVPLITLGFTTHSRTR